MDGQADCRCYRGYYYNIVKFKPRYFEQTRKKNTPTLADRGKPLFKICPAQFLTKRSDEPVLN
jgi:hypothetical protein